MSTDRYKFLEAQLDREDLTDDEFNKYNKELNDLQDGVNARKKIQAELRAIRLKELEEERELEKIESITEEMVDKMYEDSCLKYQGVNGISFRDWYTKSLKYYSIDANNVVHSCARSPQAEKIDSVPCYTHANARLRILILIRTKFNDHANRGYDFKWDI